MKGFIKVTRISSIGIIKKCYFESILYIDYRSIDSVEVLNDNALKKILPVVNTIIKCGGMFYFVKETIDEIFCMIETI